LSRHNRAGHSCARQVDAGQFEPMASGRGFFTYKDGDGVDVIVQNLKEVPPEYRAQARLLEPGSVSPSSQKAQADGPGPAARVETTTASIGRGFSVHWPSFAVGAGTSFIVGLVLVLVLRRHSRVLSLLVAALGMVAFGVGYLTFLRQQVGLKPAGWATPATILDDARSAAAAAQKQINQQEKALNEIDKTR
jgi:hypothetical protein